MMQEEQIDQHKTPDQNTPGVMDSKKDVDQSNDHKIDQDFPGYPHHPSKEKNMGTDTADNTIDERAEEQHAGPNTTGLDQRFVTDRQVNENLRGDETRNDEIGVPQNITNEDLQHPHNRPGTDLNQSASDTPRTE